MYSIKYYTIKFSKKRSLNLHAHRPHTIFQKERRGKTKQHFCCLPNLHCPFSVENKSKPDFTCVKQVDLNNGCFTFALFVSHAIFIFKRAKKLVILFVYYIHRENNQNSRT